MKSRLNDELAPGLSPGPPARPRTTVSGCPRCAGRSSDFRATRLGAHASSAALGSYWPSLPNNFQSVSACDGGRSRLPLRGSSGVPPDSLLAPLWMRGEPATVPRLPLHLVVGERGRPSGCVSTELSFGPLRSCCSPQAGGSAEPIGGREQVKVRNIRIRLGCSAVARTPINSPRSCAEILESP